MSTTTTISIAQISSDDREEHQHRIYDVTINNFTIQTVVTRSAGIVSTWLRETNATTNNNRSDIVVGFDLKLSIDYVFDHNPVAIMLLCVENRCLVYRLHQHVITEEDLSDLDNFFANGSGYKLIGERIKSKATNLMSFYSLDLGTIKIELREVAAALMNDDLMLDMSVRELAKVLLNMEIYPLLSLGDSDWDREILSMEQVKNAVLDVYLCYKIGMVFEAPHKYEPIDSCEDDTTSSSE